ncbi:hypothetical protein [Ornithinimicrobium cerasi]|uniref:hypothetical protein n=1 Tax=Ornithinimicrobium cerasi TaxID=2248773 RepID=UPI000EFDC239|nr:hypothetical protein [Ornithinimicrobium cerasi]
MPTTRTMHGIRTLSYSLQETRATDLGEIDYYPGLERPRMGYPAVYENNRYGAAWGDAPQIGGVQHIAVTAEFLAENTADQSAENVTAWGLNPANRGASWPDCVDRDSWVPLLPTWKRTWTHGVSDAPADPNSLLIGQEMGIMGTDWRTKPDWFVLAQLRMGAAVWAMYVAKLGWPLQVILNRAQVFEHLRTRRPMGFTEHWVLDNANRNDAGQVGTALATTFPWEKRHWGGPGMLPLIREELAIRTRGEVVTPGLPTPDPKVKDLQTLLNEFGHTLDVDGSAGPLTTAAATQTAADTGYTGDVKDAAALTAHLEVIMTKLLTALDALSTKVDGLPARVWDATIVNPATQVRSDARTYLAMNGQRGSETNARLRQVEASVEGYKVALEALASKQGLDPAAISATVEAAVASALGRIEADVRLTIGTEAKP